MSSILKGILELLLSGLIMRLAASASCTALFVSVKGEPLSANAVKLLFTRLVKNQGLKDFMDIFTGTLLPSIT